ncbi:MAG: efflux RND transporter periplasmic adaptor subunit [Acidiphilium sp.]
MPAARMIAPVRWIMAPLFAVTLIAAAPAPRVPVSVVTPLHYRAAIQLSGQVVAAQSTVLAASRAGMVSAILFHSGERVSQGQILLRMNQATAQARLAVDHAKAQEAAQVLARDAKLQAISGVSAAQTDADRSIAAQAQAQLALDAAQAAKLVITAPFSGVLGIRRVSLGDYLAPGTPIVTLTQTSPLLVRFAVPQTELAGIGPGDHFALSLPDRARPGAPVPVVRGVITALSPALNVTTRARSVEGQIINPNPDTLPGAFGIVHLKVGAPVAALAIPATALNNSPIGTFVYALHTAKGSTSVHAIYVHVLATSGATAIIGANPSLHRIVALGGFKLRDGEMIDPVAAAA